MITISDNRNFNGIKTVDFIRGKKLYPSVRNIVNFGMEITCNGLLCVDGISIQYKILGGVK